MVTLSSLEHTTHENSIRMNITASITNRLIKLVTFRYYWGMGEWQMQHQLQPICLPHNSNLFLRDVPNLCHFSNCLAAITALSNDLLDLILDGD